MKMLINLVSMRWAFSRQGIAIGAVAVAVLFLFRPEYSGQNLAMAFGIALDVFCATLSQFYRFASVADAMRWGRRCMLTHTAFPLAGTVVAALCAKAYAPIEVVIGLLALWLVFVMLLVPELRKRCGWASEDEDGEESAEMPESKNPVVRVWRRFVTALGRRDREWIVVIAVSMDALLSGPAKYVFAVVWTPLELVGSFPLVGFWVGLFAVMAVVGAFVLQKWVTRGNQQRATRTVWLANVVGFYLEFAVIGFFGIKAFLQGMAHLGSPIEPSVWNAVYISLGLTAIVVAVSLLAMVRHQRSEAESALIESAA